MLEGREKIASRACKLAIVRKEFMAYPSQARSD
jgi:hypothetical protein